MKMIRFYFAAIAITGLTLFACSSDDDNDTDDFDGSEVLRTASAIDRINDDDFQLAMETANDESTLQSRTSADLSATSTLSCATVTQTSVATGFPLTFNLDFGTGCTHNGITRTGSISVTFTGFFLSAGSQIIIERNNYTVNGYQVSGTVTYENLTTTPGAPQWSRTVVNGQITTPAGDVYLHSGTRTIRQTAGVNTPFVISDNVFEVSSGTATVTRQGGATLTATVTTPLVKSVSCSYISQGTLDLEGGTLDGSLDYGNGECDATAIYTHSDGQTFTVNLN